MKHRVVITGMGIWSCIGTSLKEVEANLRSGRSGIGVDPKRKEYGYQSTLTGLVPAPDLKGLLDRRQRMCLSEEAEYAFMASREAFAMAGMDEAALLRQETGVIFGNDSSAKAVVESAELMAKEKDSTMLGSKWIFQSMNSTVNMNMSTIFHLRGVNFSVSAACASGSHAIGLGYMFIQQGLQEVVLCGGAQETNLYAMASFDALDAFSKRMDTPTRASRPFDRDRDGLVPSGGAAAVLLEDYDHAKARGAHILAEVIGYGFSSNGGGISQANEDGSMCAMRRAMADAAVTADDIDYVNAHATSTPQGDMFEAKAIDSLFRGRHALVSSTKSMTGHECWMAGASEIVYSTLMMQGNFVAPNINFDNPDDDTCHLNIARHAEEREVHCALSNSFGFGGTNSALIIKQCE